MRGARAPRRPSRALSHPPHMPRPDPPVARWRLPLLALLFVFTTVYHMWLGMQVIVEDYVHHEGGKVMLIMANTFFCIVVGLACTFALLKLSFGV